MLGIQPMRDTVTREDIFQKIKYVMPKYHLSFDKFHMVFTDEAPVMVGSKTGLIAKIRAE
jgi:hypothetical protein